MRVFARPADARLTKTLLAAVLLGLGLRVALVLLAENRLDCDESTVALMSLDVLEQGARPMFFYGGSYNGGAALEAYLGAVVIALFGFSPVGFKLLLALLWTAGALLFADVCRRQLPPGQAILATAFLCLGTPFFLEWSTTARGGFAETMLFSSLLLWLARPPRALIELPFPHPAAFGLVAGLALWASEMILPLLPLAGAWLVLAEPPARRLRTAGIALSAFLIGILPLAAYNAANDWQHLRESALAGLLTPGGAPLTIAQLTASSGFVLGSGGWLLAVGVVVGVVRLARRSGRLTLAHVLLAHAVLYGLGYWLSGLRFLEIPASRVLYPLQLNLAVLIASAFDPEGLASPRIGVQRLSVAAVVAWVLLTCVALAQWGASAEPRASGSWRASWCLVDGAGLRTALTDRNIEVVFVNYWTATPLALANRVALRSNPHAPRVVPVTRLPERRSAGRPAAVALHRDSPAVARIEEALRRRETRYERWSWGPYSVLSGLDPSRLVAADLGLAAPLEAGTRPPAPLRADGFN